MLKRSITTFALFLLALAIMMPVMAEPKPTGHVLMPMSDGVKLATDYYLPEKGEPPYPVILMRSTYGRVGGGTEGFLAQGYAVVVQDVRGMGMSEGEKHVFYAEGWRSGFTDGADTVAWIKAQEWCNGKIGTHGGSALALTQMLLAPATRDVSAQSLDAGPSNFYLDTVYHGGVFLKNLVEGWLTAIGQPHLIELYKSHPYYDEYWRYFNTVDKAGEITSPALFVNGWYDIFQQGTLNGFMAREESGGEGARGNNYLIMKWSSHGPDVSKDYQFNENRFELKVSRIRDAFYAQYLKGSENALRKVAKVNYYVMGDDAPGAPGSEWRTAETWPPFPTKETPYYLHADGSLSTDAAGDDALLSFTFDPKNPCPTHGGANLLLPSGPFDQRETVKDREDILKFATGPLDAPIEVTGRVKVQLHVSSDAPDTDFTAKLLDIFPDGREILVLDNIQRVKMRGGPEKPLPLLTGPDEIVTLEIDLWSISWIFNTSHRIGLHISSSNYPRYEVNPNTGDDHPVKDGEMRSARNTVHFGAQRPSALLLPLRLDE